MTAEVKPTNCHYCGYCCAFLATVEDGRVTDLVPDPSRYPYDERILAGCRRWRMNLDALDGPDRVNYPLRRAGKRGGNEWERVSWDEALDDIAARLRALADEHGPETLASAIGGPQDVYKRQLCCRGTSALLHVNHPARINHALKRVGAKGEGKWEKIPYDQAIQEVADRLNQIKDESGAEAVASAGGTTRTDDWARRRFLNQFGTPNGFHNALLCWIPTFMAETCVAGWSPFETDLAGAKCLILWGMNPGASTLGGMNGYTDLQKNGLKIVVVDPRYSETASKADLWLPLRPGSDAALALAMLHTIIYEGLVNWEFVGEWCDGFEELQEHVAEYTPEWAAPITWLDAEQIRQAARLYAMNTLSLIHI